MKVQTEAKPYDDINITPMLDLAFVLLVIFIIMTTASVQGIKVNLPKASSAASPRPVANRSRSWPSVSSRTVPTLKRVRSCLRTTPSLPMATSRSPPSCRYVGQALAWRRAQL